jgi:hypothetical protein
MAGPKTEAEVRRWTREAILAGRYEPAEHFDKRMLERKIEIVDVQRVLKRGVRIRPYDRLPDHGGTCWRVSGPDLDDKSEISVGIETYDKDGEERVHLCTVLPKKELKKK